nr:DJ-1/PfpI family protein [Leptolyngbya sp. FACHB-541]
MTQKYEGKHRKISIEPDGIVSEARVEDFDAVLISGGIAAERMRIDIAAVQFVQTALNQNHLVAAIGHGPQVLIEADVLKGRDVTGARAIRKDLQNAGANYIDEPLVIDGILVTARRLGDLPIFTAAILSRLELPLASSLNQETDAAWWKLAEMWGGSSKVAIATHLNTILHRQTHLLEAFQRYTQKLSNSQLSSSFKVICSTIRHHIQQLENRFAEFQVQESLLADNNAEVNYSQVFARLERSQLSHDTELLCQTLHSLRTEITEVQNLSNQLTDPTTTALFDDLEADLVEAEQQIAALYHMRLEISNV